MFVNISEESAETIFSDILKMDVSKALPSTALCGVLSQKTVILLPTAVKTSNFML
jgi:hypothetical protein